MKSFIQDLDNIISDCNNQINDKIIGINYLEIFKYHFINSINKNNFLLDLDIPGLEIDKKYGNNNLLFKVQSYKDSTSKIKNVLSENQLSIVLSGFKSIKIFENVESKASTSFNLHKNAGIALTKNTIISESISKETALLDVICFPNEEDFGDKKLL